MWKCVSRRIRDTFERSVNHFDKRSATGVVNSPGNVSEDKGRRERGAPSCSWFCSRKCWSSFQDGNNTNNNNRWNFDQLNRSWIGAITWSSALVVGWYTSQLIHLKLKYHCKAHRKQFLELNCHAKDYQKVCSLNDLLSSLHPYVSYVNKNAVYLNSVSKLEKIIGTFTPTVHLISNGDEGDKEDKVDRVASGSTTTPDTSNDALGDVLNSIENRLGLAAIENGQHQDGLNLLRSAANRNHAPALYNLGLCYEMGLGVSIDEKSAMELYRSAAALEHPGALYNLGIYYGQGRGGLARDTETATRLLRLAAVKGQKDAIDALKTLDTDSVESPRHKDVEHWTYRYTPYSQDDSIVPTHTTLFVENVNYLQAQRCEATVY